MRGLRHLIPKEWQQSFNESSYGKWVVFALMLIIGPLLVRHGLRGVKEKRVVSKGREYTGGMAVLVGSIQAVVGVIMCLGAVMVAILG
jgi:hypothetical protein